MERKRGLLRGDDEEPLEEIEGAIEDESVDDGESEFESGSNSDSASDSDANGTPDDDATETEPVDDGSEGDENASDGEDYEKLKEMLKRLSGEDSESFAALTHPAITFKGDSQNIWTCKWCYPTRLLLSIGAVKEHLASKVRTAAGRSLHMHLAVTQRHCQAEKRYAKLGVEIPKLNLPPAPGSKAAIPPKKAKQQRSKHKVAANVDATASVSAASPSSGDSTKDQKQRHSKEPTASTAPSKFISDSPTTAQQKGSAKQNVVTAHPAKAVEEKTDNQRRKRPRKSAKKRVAVAVSVY